MKISNEVKIGALTIIAIVFLILGFNFLKGKSVLKTGFFLYGKYSDLKKLGNSNAVYANGLQIGSVYSTSAQDPSLKVLIVEMKMTQDYNIPDNSVATIETNPLGAPTVEIQLGDSKTFAKTGDTLQTLNSAGLIGSLSNKIGPLSDQVTSTLQSFDSLMQNFNTLLDTNTKGNIRGIVSNLNNTTKGLAKATLSLEQMLDAQTGVVAKSLENINNITGSLAGNTSKIDSTLQYLQTTSRNLSQADVDGLINRFKQSADSLSSIINKINSTDGSVGALINDKALYNNLNNVTRSLNVLIDDLRVHPKRYASISIFGGKNKGNYLTQPLDDSLTKK